MSITPVYAEGNRLRTFFGSMEEDNGFTET